MKPPKREKQRVGHNSRGTVLEGQMTHAEMAALTLSNGAAISRRGKAPSASLELYLLQLKVSLAETATNVRFTTVLFPNSSHIRSFLTKIYRRRNQKDLEKGVEERETQMLARKGGRVRPKHVSQSGTPCARASPDLSLTSRPPALPPCESTPQSL